MLPKNAIYISVVSGPALSIWVEVVLRVTPKGKLQQYESSSGTDPVAHVRSWHEVAQDDVHLLIQLTYIRHNAYDCCLECSSGHRRNCIQ
jgi:hypothetical protein